MIFSYIYTQSISNHSFTLRVLASLELYLNIMFLGWLVHSTPIKIISILMEDNCNRGMISISSSF